MKWPSLDESVSLCICVLTVACNFEMQPSFFLLLLAIRCGGGGFGSRVGALNLTVPIGSGQPISGTGCVRSSV